MQTVWCDIRFAMRVAHSSSKPKDTSSSTNQTRLSVDPDFVHRPSSLYSITGTVILYIVPHHC